MISEEGSKIITNGWKAAFITEALEQGIKGLKLLHPFFEIDQLINENNQTIIEAVVSQDAIHQRWKWRWRQMEIWRNTIT